MQKIVAPSDTSTTASNIIYYNFVGNFVPPEWRGLTSNDGKTLSKSGTQLLAVLVSLSKKFKNSNKLNNEEIQESYYYFEQLLGVCQRRIRQCLLELEHK